MVLKKIKKRFSRKVELNGTPGEAARDVFLGAGMTAVEESACNG